MARPPRAIRPIEKSISLPETIVAQVELMLYSDLEEKVPHGAWARYIHGLIEADLKKRARAAKGDKHEKA